MYRRAAGHERFVIAGDMNSDPLDGDSVPGSTQQLLDHPRVNDPKAPASAGGVWAARFQGGANATHESDPQFDTADFDDRVCCGPGNLRADYVLPSKASEDPRLGHLLAGADEKFFYLTGNFPFVPTSDHREVWVDRAARRSSSAPPRAGRYRRRSR